MSAESAAAALLGRQLKQMQNDKDIPGISCGLVQDGNIFEWEVMLMIDDEIKFYGGKFDIVPPLPFLPLAQLFTNVPSKGANFRARLKFPPEYPLRPPSLIFLDPVPFHPNIYPDTGALCISILHPPEDDKYGYETAAERWNPTQTPETILISVISLFASPNDESPANPEAAKLLREQRAGKSTEYRKRCRACVRRSLGED